MNDRRRFLLATLSESGDGVASLSDLTEAIARRDSEERGVPREPSLEEVAVSLHHVHLPKLQASGLVDYDELLGAFAIWGVRGRTRSSNSRPRVIREATPGPQF